MSTTTTIELAGLSSADAFNKARKALDGGRAELIGSVTFERAYVVCGSEISFQQGSYLILVDEDGISKGMRLNANAYGLLNGRHTVGPVVLVPAWVLA